MYICIYNYDILKNKFEFFVPSFISKIKCCISYTSLINEKNGNENKATFPCSFLHNNLETDFDWCLSLLRNNKNEIAATVRNFLNIIEQVAVKMILTRKLIILEF